MIRNLVGLAKRAVSPLIVLNVILMLMTYSLLRRPDSAQVGAYDAPVAIDGISKRSVEIKESQPTVLVIPLESREHSKISRDGDVKENPHAAETTTRSNKPADKTISEQTKYIKCNTTTSKSQPIANKMHDVDTEDSRYTMNRILDNSQAQLKPLSARQIREMTLLYEEKRSTYVVPDIQQTNLVNCNALFANSSREMAKARDLVKTHIKVPLYEEYYINWTKDCQDFRDRRGYVEIPLTEEEQNYPLAFSISMFKDVEQAERLLRAIYQPQNIYCIHIDTKSPLLIHDTMRRIADCFHNVFIATHLKKVKWGDWSVLLPAVTCMRDFLKYYRGKWKYFINLTGQEFPLRTNYELVRIAKIFNGSNDIAGSADRMDPERVKYMWTHRWSKTYQQTIFYNTFIPRVPPPYDLTFYKGEIHGLFSPKFVEFIIESEVGQVYLDWCVSSGHPSEHYWNTLNYNRHLKAPGGYYGPLDLATKYSLAPAVRAKHWQDENYIPRECQGQVVRGICVYGLGDLPWLAKRRELVANKFYLTYHNLALDCLEERHRNRTKLKDRVGAFLDEDYYRGLPTVLYSRKDGLWT